MKKEGFDKTPLPVKGVFDPLSITYFFRLGKLKSGITAQFRLVMVKS